MKVFFYIVLSAFSLLNCSSSGTGNDLLKPDTIISLPDISGRIDHLAINPDKQLLYVAALGNNTLETIDLKSGRIIHSIKNLNEPQGVVFIPENNSIFVSNGGNGECDVFNAETFQKISALQLGDDADNVRYDSIEKKIYVGYGNGGIAIIDAHTFKLLSQIKLSGHPEAFEIDKTTKKIYVNVPDSRQIEVIDLEKKSVIQKWKMTEPRANFPMALDDSSQLLMVGCRHPARLLVLDARTGKTVYSSDMDGDVDDIFYDKNSKRVYLSCGSGYVDIFIQTAPGKYISSGRVATHSGARTSLFVPEQKKLFVGSPASLGTEAKILIYKAD